jgi:hypothetical protein
MRSRVVGESLRAAPRQFHIDQPIPAVRFRFRRTDIPDRKYKRRSGWDWLSGLHRRRGSPKHNFSGLRGKPNGRVFFRIARKGNADIVFTCGNRGFSWKNLIQPFWQDLSGIMHCRSVDYGIIDGCEIDDGFRIRCRGNSTACGSQEKNQHGCRSKKKNAPHGLLLMLASIPPNGWRLPGRPNLTQTDILADKRKAFAYFSF